MIAVCSQTKVVCMRPQICLRHECSNLFNKTHIFVFTLHKWAKLQ